MSAEASYRFPYAFVCYNPGVEQQFRSHTPRAARAPRRPADLNIIDFVERRLGFYPDPYQRLILTSTTKRGILNCKRQWGKTTVSAAKAVYRVATVRNSLVVVASPSLRQSGDGCNTISLLLDNGSRIVGLPENEATIRGFSGLSMLIIDKAARVSDDVYYQALRPMLSVGDGELWMLSTPCGKRGFFYETWKQPEVNSQEEFLRISVQADDCPRISPRFLEEQRAVMTGDSFRQEHMCEFIGSGDALFDPDLIEAAMDDDLEPI